MKVAIVIPSALNTYLKKFELSYRDTVTYLQSRLDDLPFNIEILQDLRPDKFPIDANRNHAAAEILEKGFDTSIWMDADMTFPKEFLFKLLNNRYYPIVTGIYHLKFRPFYPVIFRETQGSNFKWFKPVYKYPKDDFFYADAMGMGAVKIDRCVFEDIAKLHNGEKIEFFRYLENPINIDFIKDDTSEDRKHDIMLHDKYLIRDVSEDMHFCKLIRDAGYKIVVDPTIQCGHISDIVIDKDICDNFFEASMAMIKERDPDTHKYIQDNLCQAEAIKKQN